MILTGTMKADDGSCTKHDSNLDQAFKVFFLTFMFLRQEVCLPDEVIKMNDRNIKILIMIWHFDTIEI